MAKQTNLFEMLGIEVPTTNDLKESRTKKEKKSTTTKSKNTKSSKATTGEEQIEVGKDGISIITGYYPEITLNITDFKPDCTEESLLVKPGDLVRVVIEKGAKSFIEGCTKVHKLKSGKYLLTICPGGKTFTAGKELSGTFNIVLGGFETSISGEKITLYDIEQAWCNSYPEAEKICEYDYDEERRIIVPRFRKRKFEGTEPTNYDVCIFGLQEFKYDGTKKIEEFLKENYQILEGNYFTVFSVDGSTLFVVPETRTVAKPAAKVELYPTNVTVSLAFTRFELTPDMFGGKDKIDKKELLTKVIEDYPEYSEERTTVEYDKKLGMIILILKSAKKGSTSAICNPVQKKSIIPYSEELQEIGDGIWTTFGNEHYLLTVCMQDIFYRIENTPAGLFCASSFSSDINNRFLMRLPKIPRKIMEEAYHFFEIVNNCLTRSNEAAVQLFWNPKKQQYFLHYPKQRVATSWVEFERTDTLEREHILVMDIHSHGVIRPFFSATDDNDELGTRLYCVFGNMQDDTQYHFALRAGTGGNFITLNETDIFKDFTDGMFVNRKSESFSAKMNRKLQDINAEMVEYY